MNQTDTDRMMTQAARRIHSWRGLGSLAVAALLAACSLAPRAPAPALLDASAIERLLASPERSSADRSNDQRRKPAPLLAFMEVRRGMWALDLSAGGGYTTELLARAAGREGKVWGQSQPREAIRGAPAAPEGGAAAAPAAGAPAAPARIASAVAVNNRQQALLRAGVDAAPIEAVVQRFETPVPASAPAGSIDRVTLMFNYHDLVWMGVDRERMNRAVFAALKPGGLYIIGDHAGRPGTGISEAGTLHRIDEQYLRAEIERAGFRFVAEAGFLRNPNDPRDRNNPDPPQPKDDFVMKFVKP